MSRTASTWQSTELENRNAFTVQLQSLLSQVKSFALYAAKNNSSLSSLQKSKLEELHNVNDSWLEAIGDVQNLRSPLTHAAALQDTTKAISTLSLSSLSSAIANPSFAISPSPLPEHDNDSSATESSLISLSQSRCTNDDKSTHECTHDSANMNNGEKMSSKQESKNDVHSEYDEVERGDASLEVSLLDKNKALEEEKESKEVQTVEKVNDNEESDNNNDEKAKLTATTTAASTEKNAQEDSINNSEKREVKNFRSSLTVEVEVESVIGDKTLAELVQLLTLLHSNDLPDARKFKALALALTRLLMVRCEIVLKSALRRIVFYTFKAPVVQAERQQEFEQHEKEKPEEKENIDNINSNFTLGRASPFIASARDIRNSCQALSRCVMEMAVNENWSDSMAVRFAVKFAADILQIMRKSILYLEFNLLHIMFATHKSTVENKNAADAEGNMNTTESININKQEQKVKIEEGKILTNDVKMAYKEIIPNIELVQCKVLELKAQWGPFVCNALLQFSPVMDVCINVLVRAAGLVVVSSSSSSPSPTRIITSTDTAGSNTNSNSSATVTSNQNVYNTSTGNEAEINIEPMEVVKRSAQEELRWLSEEVIRGVHFRCTSQKDQEEEQKKENEKVSTSPHVSKRVQKGNLQLSGLSVLLNLQISWTLEVCVALSHYSGDDSDGKKLTSQLMYNIFVNWSKLLCRKNSNNKIRENAPSQENAFSNAQIAQEQQEEKEQSISILLQVNALLQHLHWRKPVLSGLLTCILSSEQAIRFCGLTTLSILTTFAALSHKLLPEYHLHQIGTSDIGYLYKKCLFKLLAPQSNCSQNVKKEVLWHVICNFTSTLVPLPLLQTSTHSHTNEMTHNSMLLYFYNQYDLQISWHELNLIEEVVQLLSAIVRQGSRDDFARMQTTSAKTTTTTTTTTTNTTNNSFMNTGDSSNANNVKSRLKMNVEKAVMRQLQQELPNEPGSPVFIKSLENNTTTTTNSSYTSLSLSSQSTPFLSNIMSVEETWLPNPLLILPLASSMAVLTYTSSEHSLSLSSSSSSSYSLSLTRSKPPFVLQQEWLDSFSLPSLALYGLTSLAEVLCTELPRLTTQTSNTDRNKNMLHDVLLEELRNTLHLKLRERKNAEQTRAELFNASPEKAIIRLFHLTQEDLQPEGCDNFVAHRYDHHYLPFTFAENQRENGHQLNEEEMSKEETDDLATNINSITTKSFTDAASVSYNSYNSSNTSSLHKIRSIVLFFRNVTALSPDAIAEYLTLPSCFPLQVCAAYMASLPLAGKSLPEALRELLTTLPLPREGQRIERLLEYFSAAYYSANAHTLGPFTPSVYNWDNLEWCATTHNTDNIITSNKEKYTGNKEIDRQVFPFTEDTFCFVATVATVMLNTDQHNPHAGAKMNLKSFIAQMKSSVNSIYFTNGYAENIFYHISHHFLGKPRIATENNGGSATNNSNTNNLNESIKTGEQTSMSLPSSSSSSSSMLTSIHKNSAGRGNAQDSYHGINALFISNEERQQLAFAMERQQLMNTTREFIVHQYTTNTMPSNTHYDTTCINKIKNGKNIIIITTSIIANELHELRHHLSLLRDALLMNWSTLLPVFNVGVQGSMPRKVTQPSLSSPPSTLQNVAYYHYNHNNNQVQQEQNKQESVLLYNIHSETELPEGVLLPCIRGLQCLFYLAAAFDLPTESSEVLVALVRLLSINRSYRVNNNNTNKNSNLSQKKESKEEENESSASRITRCVLTAIFSVAASPFVLHLSTYCWNHIFTLLLPFSTPLNNTSSSGSKSSNVQKQSTMRNNEEEEEEEERRPSPEEKVNHGVSHELEVLCTSLFTRIEHVTRESCEARRVLTDDALYLDETGTTTTTDKDNCTSSITEGENVNEVRDEQMNELHYNTARMASASVHAMLNAMVELLEDESIRHHSIRFAQLLHLLHRILTYMCIKRSTSMNEQCVGVINERIPNTSNNNNNNNAMTELYKSCMNEEVRVVTYVNVKDFYYLLLPQLMALLDRCSSKDETCLSAILNCIVELLNIMWNSYTTEFSIVSEEISVTNKPRNIEEEHELENESKKEGEEEKADNAEHNDQGGKKNVVGQSKRILTRDDVPEEVIACFNVFERILAHTNYKVSNNMKTNSDINDKNNVYYTNAEYHAELLRRHILQTIKELIVRSLHTFTSFAAQWHNMTKYLLQNESNSNICKSNLIEEWSIGAKHGLVSLHTLYEMWRRLLNPLMTMITSRDEYQHNDDSYTLSQLTLHQLVLIATGLQGNQNNNTIKNNNTISMSSNNNVNVLFTLYYSRLLSAADKQRLEANSIYDKSNSNDETINYKKMMTSSNTNALGKVKRDVCEYCGFVFRHMSNELITLLLAQVAFAGTLFASCTNNTTRTTHNNENSSNEKRMMKLTNIDANALDVEEAMSCLNELCHLCSAVLSQINVSLYSFASNEQEQVQKQDNNNVYMEINKIYFESNINHVSKKEENEVEEVEKSTVERDVVFTLGTSMHTPLHTAKYTLQLLFALLLVESNVVRMNVMERIRVLLAKCSHVELLQFVMRQLSILFISAAKDMNTLLLQRYRQIGNSTKINNNNGNSTTAETTLASASSSFMCNCACINTEWNSELLLTLPLSFSIKAEIRSLQFTSSRNFLMSLLSAALRLISHDMCFIKPEYNNNNSASSSLYASSSSSSSSLHTSLEKVESMSKLISNIQLNTTLFASFTMECGAPLSLMLLISKPRASLATDMKDAKKEIDKNSNTNHNTIRQETEEKEEQHYEQKYMEVNELTEESLEMATEVIKNMMQAISEYNKRVNEAMNQFAHFFLESNISDNNNNTYQDQEIREQVHQYCHTLATVKNVYHTMIMSGLTAIMWKLRNLLIGSADVDGVSINKHNLSETNYDEQMHHYISTLLEHKESKKDEKKDKDSDLTSSECNVRSDIMISSETDGHYTLHTEIQELPCDTINTYCTLLNYVSWTLPSVCTTMKRVTAELEKYNKLIDILNSEIDNVNAKRNFYLYKSIPPLPIVNDEVILNYLSEHINILLSLYSVYDGNDNNDNEQRWHVSHENVVNRQNTTNINVRKKSWGTEMNVTHVPIKQLCYVYLDLALSDANAWTVHSVINMFVKIITVTRSLQTRLTEYTERVSSTKQKQIAPQEDHVARIVANNSSNNSSEVQKYMSDVYVDLCAAIEMWIQKSIKLESITVLDDISSIKCDNTESLHGSNVDVTHNGGGGCVIDQKETISQGTKTNKLYEFQRVLCSSGVFNELITLLTPHAGSVISAIRDYLSWYIDRSEQSYQQKESEHETVVN